MSKTLAEKYLRARAPLQVIPGVLQLRFTTNPGGAFGILGSRPWLFFSATVAVSLAIVASSFRPGELANSLALGMVLGGSLGNLTDRILRGPGVSGEVVDFIDLHVWPVFNLADSAIVVGALLLLMAGFRRNA